MKVDQASPLRAARETWAAHLREERERNWREGADRHGFPRTFWNGMAEEDRRAGEGEEDRRPDYEERKEQWFEESDLAWEMDPATHRACGVGHYGAFDGAYYETLLWMEKHDKLAWHRFNRALVEQKIAPGRGCRGPFFPNEWWCAFDHVYDSNGIPTGGRDYRLLIPEEKLPKRLDERIVFLMLTHIRGATIRWRVRRELGRSDEDFVTDIAGEMGSVWGGMVPWEAEWIRVTVNGHGQQDHGYSKLCEMRWGPYTNERRIKEKQIVALARRMFKVPTLYAAGVDEDTGQAAFF